MKTAKVLKISLLAFLALTLLQAGWLVRLWLSGAVFGLPYLVWLAALIAVSLIVGILVVVYRRRIWVHDPVAAELKAITAAAQKQFKQARARARIISRNDAAVPWYLFLAMKRETRSTVMAELGYVAFGDPITHKGVVFTTWTSPTAVAYRIEIEPTVDPTFDVLNIVLRLLFKNRPSLAVNAAFVEYELAGLMQANSAETGNVSTINRILNSAAAQFGIDLPVHVALVGLEHMPDLGRAALLTEHLGGQTIFGGFLSPEEPDLPSQIDRLFGEMIENLNATQFAALQKQLAPEFCASLLNAPFQLSLLQAQLRDRMATLAQPLPPRTVPLNVQSIAFIGARSGMAAVDPLCQVAGQRLFGATPKTTSAVDTVDSVTIENASLLATAFHREGFAVNRNRRYVVQGRMKASLWSILLGGIVALFTLVVMDNYRVYGTANANLDRAFDRYYSAVGGITTDSDFLVNRILLLEPLRTGLDAYAPLDAIGFRRNLPNWSMEETYRTLYEEELTIGLQASLVSFLEKETFAFNSLADGVELIRLASVEAQLHGDQDEYKTDLIEFYTQGLAAQGEVSGAFQTQLQELLDDLFTLNRPPPERNERLREVVATTLSGLDTAQLLYASLMRRSAYSERVDLRQLIGPRFFEVFVPVGDAQVYLVPRGYTREGFDALFEDGDMPELSWMLNSYEDVIGELDSAQKNATMRRVAQSYTADYISRWNAFLSGLRLRDAKSWGDAQVLMQSLTNPSENLLDRLTVALDRNTNIEVFLPEPAAADGAVAAAPAQAPTAPRLAPASASAEAATALNIRSAFRPYLDALTAQDEQKSQFDLFLDYARDVNLWLEEATKAANGPGQYLFEQFQTAESANPLAVLNAFVVRSELDIIRNFGRNIVTTLDDSAMAFVYDFIDGEWQRQIMGPHQAKLTNTFPFNPYSDTDFPLIEFTDLFAPGGKLELFTQTYLSRFRTVEGVFVPRPTFLLTGSAELSAEAQTAFQTFAQITDTLFVADQPFLEFGLRTGLMSNNLSNLTVTSGTTLHQFSHGPIFWDDQSWPVAGVQDSDLTLRFYQRSRAVFNKTYRGPWSWFRLVQDGAPSINPSLGVGEAVFRGDGGKVALQFNVAERVNPFGPGFFYDFVLPETLFPADFTDDE